jgi:quinol monooxygenase YgiN
MCQLDMTKFVEADERIKFSEQLEETVGRIVEIIKFNVKPEEADQFLKPWEKDATYYKSQPGFISAQLHRGIGGSGIFVIYAVWESTALLNQALSNVDLKELLSDYPTRAVAYPHIFKKVAVPGICID